MKNITLAQAYEIIFKDYPDVVGVKELCSILGMCNKKVYELIRLGKISAIPCIRKYRVAKISVIEYLLNIDSAA